MTPTALSVAVLASYFVFYSLYDKSSGSLAPGKMWSRITSSQRSFGNELNKILALSGLTCMGLAFLLSGMYNGLLVCSAVQLNVHAVYSVVVIYGADPDRVWRNNPKVLAILAGQAGLVMLSYLTLMPALLGQQPHVRQGPLLSNFAALALGFLHFLGMEAKGGKLNVRPFAYLALLTTAGAVLRHFGVL